MKKNKARSSNKGEITSISPKQLETIQRQIKISSGPIPSAEELSKYNKIEPELVNRIVSMAENQQNHRLNSEKKTIDNQNNNIKRGQILIFILGILGLGSAVAISITDAYAGSIVGVGSLAAIAASGSPILIRNETELTLDLKGQIQKSKLLPCFKKQFCFWTRTGVFQTELKGRFNGPFQKNTKQT